MDFFYYVTTIVKTATIPTCVGLVQVTHNGFVKIRETLMRKRKVLFFFVKFSGTLLCWRRRTWSILLLIFHRRINLKKKDLSKTLMIHNKNSRPKHVNQNLIPFLPFSFCSITKKTTKEIDVTFLNQAIIIRASFLPPNDPEEIRVLPYDRRRYGTKRPWCLVYTNLIWFLTISTLDTLFPDI